MKILICGKGGCGKSTITAMLGKHLANKGYRVLIVDADESNPGLYRMLGLSKIKTLAEYLGGKKQVKAILNNPELPKTFEEIPEEILSKRENLSVMSIGKIEEPGEGCACPYGVLAKKFLKNLQPKKGEIVLVDTEAGIEHFGRGIDLEVDVIVNVAELNLESIELSRKIEKLAEKAGLKHIFVLNKALPEILDKVNVKPDVVIPFNQKFIYDSLEGKEVEIVPQIEELWECISKLLAQGLQWEAP